MKIAPAVAQKNIGLSVGIFWKIGDILLLDRTPLPLAELYGDCLTHPRGHYERWEHWRGLGVRQLRTQGYPTLIMTTEYEAWPRGRVVYDNSKDVFVVYADRRLHALATVRALIAAFGIADHSWRIMSDSHYV